MKALRSVAIMAGIVVLEVILSVKVTFVPVNLAKEPFRRGERAAALIAYATDRSPENASLYREEVRLVSRQVLHRQLAAAAVLLAVLLVLDGMAVLWWRHHEERKPMGKGADVTRIATAALADVKTPPRPTAPQ